jgi:Fic family protein
MSLTPFQPNFTITPRLANALIRIEAVRQSINDLPITPLVLKTLRETARLFTTHYSTMIEGNRLTQEEVIQVVQSNAHFPGRERDEHEVKGFYAALDEMEAWVARSLPITEKRIQTLHALLLSDGRKQVKPTPYRDGQNVIRDSLSGGIVYMPPEAKDVPALMGAMLSWLDHERELPIPLKAGIAHYQFATIHPYYDGNGRTARLLTNLILHLGGYDLKGIYSLEEYYARNLNAYYAALSVGPSHNYYLGRAESDITKWIEYFCDGMAEAFEKVRKRAMSAASSGVSDQSEALRRLDAKQRKALELFEIQDVVTAKEIGALFGFKSRTASELCRKWVESGFLVVMDNSKKSRKYKPAKPFI